MKTIRINTTIDAPVERVFAAVTDMGKFSEALPHVVEIEYLTERKTGVGTRFRETRLMGKRESITELEVTEHRPNEHVRMVTDSHGAVWDTVFSVAPRDTGTQLTLAMDARAYRLVPRIMNTLFRNMIAKAVAKDMECLKSYCESHAQ